MKDTATSLYEYYIKAGVNPVYAAFSSNKDLDAYELSRRSMFEYNLRLPVASFQNKTLIEFGPASGENALTFAKWGARLTLVEPVNSFVDVLNEYFSFYGLKKQVEDIVCLPIEDYRTDNKFDFIVAEGFVFQIGKPDYWIPLLLSFAKDDSFIFFSHSEMAGYLIEMIKAKSYQIIYERQGCDPLQLARRMFQKKWDSVPHVRKFESWVGDNLRNPLVTRGNLNTLSNLQNIMASRGVYLWSSWPSVYTHQDVTWIKKTFDPSKDIPRCNQAYMKLIPSLIMGAEVPTTVEINSLGDQIIDNLQKAMSLLGTHEVGLNDENVGAAISYLRKLNELFKQVVCYYSQSDFYCLWESILECLLYLESKKDDKVIALFNEGGPLSKYWGSPNFYTIWHKFPCVK